jgi:hypothetical protein
MKNLSDVRALAARADQIYQAQVQKSQAAHQAQLFPLYEQCPEITRLLNQLENGKGIEYFIDGSVGDLMSYIDVPSEIMALPEIEEFFEVLHPWAHLDRNYQRLEQCHGDFIYINHHAGRRSPALARWSTGDIILRYDQLIEDGHPTITEDEYIAAKVELAMREKGYFPAIVELDVQGGYLRHFRTHLGHIGDNDLTQIQKIVDDYENYSPFEEEI